MAETVKPSWGKGLGSAVVLVVLIVLFVGYCSKQQTTSPSDTQTTSRTSSPTVYLPGQEYHSEGFGISVPAGYSVLCKTSLGSGYATKEVEDLGTYFCLVPVCIANHSNATKTFVAYSWRLSAGTLTFEPASGADYYLDGNDKINATDIPPGVARCGKLVFLVTSKARTEPTLLLQLTMNLLGTQKGKFEIPQAVVTP
jgi:hypothetical protein